MKPLSRSRTVPHASPSPSLRRQRLELLGIYLGSLAGMLLVFAVVVREGFRHIARAEVHAQLSIVGARLAALPIPGSGTARYAQNWHRDLLTRNQQQEWFKGDERMPFFSLGEVHSLGPIPARKPQQRFTWQERDDAIALVLPVDAGGLGPDGQPRFWLRVSQGLERLQTRIQQLDLALASAVSLAMVLSTVSALLLARRLVEPLERSLRRLRDFGQDASHELRGPLAALAANAELGLVDCPEGDNPQRRRFEAIASATNQMQGMIEDLLLLAREDREPVEHLQRFDLSELVAEQLTLYGDALALRRQHLVTSLQPDLLMLGQVGLVRQMVRNLIDNAHRYSPDAALVQVTLQRKGRHALLEISDSGPGLTRAQLPRVFDRFWRATPHRSDGGSGMGLAIASRICHSHGGEIKVFSAAGQGCRFVVSLPLTQA